MEASSPTPPAECVTFDAAKVLTSNPHFQPSGASALLAYCALGPQPVLLWRSVLKTSREPQLICQCSYFPLLGRRDVARR
jgi:hypothetical protein